MVHDREALSRLAWQTALFCDSPKRSELAKLVPAWGLGSVRCRVFRNHSFEHVSTLMEKWMNWYSRRCSIWISDYDDSLSFISDGVGPFDLDLVWVDLNHYAGDLDPAWLVARVEVLRAESRNPILLATIGGAKEFRVKLSEGLGVIGSVVYHDFEDSFGGSAVAMYSDRTVRLTGTRLSERAMVFCARELACRLIPACLGFRRKAIVLDLDGTLYRGVLGEQGALGVEFTENHRLLQESLLGLKNRGYFLALASRNEEEDVRGLFSQRDDFPLRWNDFSAFEIGWHNKSSSLVAIAEKLRIGIDSLVFVDDNPGELMEIEARFPSVGLVHAMDDASITSSALLYFPGLWNPRLSREDLLRASDLELNTQRESLMLKASDPKSYLSSLGVSLDFFLDDRKQLARMVELSSKTNQFNVALSRFSEIDFDEILKSDSKHIVTVGLADKLSDSGLIALCVVQLLDTEVIVEELAISCRALGRGLEDIIIGESINIVIDGRTLDFNLKFKYSTGPRNKPALAWLAKHASSELQEAGLQSVSLWNEENKELSSVINLRYHL